MHQHERFFGFCPGDRVALIGMGADPHTGKHDPAPVAPGSQGTLVSLTEWFGDDTVIADIAWDSGRTLNAILPVDKLALVARPRSRYFAQQLEGS